MITQTCWMRSTYTFSSINQFNVYLHVCLSVQDTIDCDNDFQDKNAKANELTLRNNNNADVEQPTLLLVCVCV